MKLNRKVIKRMLSCDVVRKPRPDKHAKPKLYRPHQRPKPPPRKTKRDSYRWMIAKLIERAMPSKCSLARQLIDAFPADEGDGPYLRRLWLDEVDVQLGLRPPLWRRRRRRKPLPNQLPLF